MTSLLPILLLWSASPDQVPLTVVQRGLVLDVEQAEADLPVKLKLEPLPNRPLPSSTRSADLAKILSLARKRYIEADFEHCRERLGEVRIRTLLAAADRLTAARALLFTVACRVGEGDLTGAQQDALRFATFGLQIPPDVDAVTPEVEATLAEALEQVAKTARAPLAIASSAPHTGIAVDGVEPSCVAPCTIDLMPGDHVIQVSADGFSPASKLVRVEASGSEVRFDLDPAPSELAAQQWTARYVTAPVIDSAPSLRLLAVALNADRLVLLDATPEENGLRIQGVFARSGVVRARAEQNAVSAADQEAATSVLRELLITGQVLEPAPPLYERPWFWVAVGVAAVAAGAVTAALLYQPEPTVNLYLGD